MSSVINQIAAPNNQKELQPDANTGGRIETFRFGDHTIEVVCLETRGPASTKPAIALNNSVKPQTPQSPIAGSIEEQREIIKSSTQDIHRMFADALNIPSTKANPEDPASS